MASENAKLVALEVLDNIGKGKKINLRKIAKKNGYADNTADNPKNIVETQTYQDIVNPVIEKMETERNRILTALTKKKLSKERYRDLIDGLDKITKNIQLLGGKPTENLNIGNLLDKLDDK